MGLGQGWWLCTCSAGGKRGDEVSKHYRLYLSFKIALSPPTPSEQIQSSVGRCMVQNPIYGSSVDIYEELPDGTPLHHIGFNGASAVAVGMTTLPPSVPPPRKTEVEQELSESEREAIEAKLESQDAVSLSSGGRCEETEDCYTVMSPAGTLTVLPRNRHSTASLNANWPMAGTL